MEHLFPGSDFGKCCLWQWEPLKIIEQLIREGMDRMEARKSALSRSGFGSKFCDG